jgi:acyl dehydratase/CBS domain-containing protein
MPLGLTVADVMSGDVQTVASDASVAAVARRIGESAVGSLVVVEDGSPVGIVTDTDLVNVLSDGRDPEALAVGDVMSGPLHTVGPDENLVAAVRAFHEHDIGHLVVLDEGDLAGVVSTTDLGNYVPQVLHREWLRRRHPETEPRFAVRPETASEHDDWAFESWTSAERGLAVGDRVAFEKTLSEEDVEAFADASGDTNRLHLDGEFAARTRFGGRIAHGTLVGGLVSAALARLPGLTIYLSQDLSFLGPVPIGSRARATCEVVESLGRDRYVLTTDVHRVAAESDPSDPPNGEQVIEGEAVVLVDPEPEGLEARREPVEE